MIWLRLITERCSHNPQDSTNMQPWRRTAGPLSVSRLLFHRKRRSNDCQVRSFLQVKSSALPSNASCTTFGVSQLFCHPNNKPHSPAQLHKDCGGMRGSTHSGKRQPKQIVENIALIKYAPNSGSEYIFRLTRKFELFRNDFEQIPGHGCKSVSPLYSKCQAPRQVSLHQAAHSLIP